MLASLLSQRAAIQHVLSSTTTPPNGLEDLRADEWAAAGQLLAVLQPIDTVVQSASQRGGYPLAVSIVTCVVVIWRPALVMARVVCLSFLVVCLSHDNISETERWNYRYC